MVCDVCDKVVFGSFFDYYVFCFKGFVMCIGMGSVQVEEIV